MKKGYVDGRTWSINTQYFWELCVSRADFVPMVMEIRKLLKLPKLKALTSAGYYLGLHPTDKEWKRLSDQVGTILEYRKVTLDHCGIDLRKAIFTKIEKICDEFDLGKEWEYSLLDFALTGIMIPPMGNVVIQRVSTPQKLNL